MPWKVNVPPRAFPVRLVRFPLNVSVEFSSNVNRCSAVRAPVVSNVPLSNLPTRLVRLPENVNVPTRVMFLPILLVRLPTNVNTPSRFFATRLVSEPEKVSVPASDWKNVTPPLGTSHKERKSANTPYLSHQPSSGVHEDVADCDTIRKLTTQPWFGPMMMGGKQVEQYAAVVPVNVAAANVPVSTPPKLRRAVEKAGIKADRVGIATTSPTTVRVLCIATAVGSNLTIATDARDGTSILGLTGARSTPADE